MPGRGRVCVWWCPVLRPARNTMHGEYACGSAACAVGSVCGSAACAVGSGCGSAAWAGVDGMRGSVAYRQRRTMKSGPRPAQAATTRATGRPRRHLRRQRRRRQPLQSSRHAAEPDAVLSVKRQRANACCRLRLPARSRCAALLTVELRLSRQRCHARTVV